MGKIPELWKNTVMETALLKAVEENLTDESLIRFFIDFYEEHFPLEIIGSNEYNIFCCIFNFIESSDKFSKARVLYENENFALNCAISNFLDLTGQENFLRFRP